MKGRIADQNIGEKIVTEGSSRNVAEIDTMAASDTVAA
jgi:hypothetical protein